MQRCQGISIPALVLFAFSPFRASAQLAVAPKLLTVPAKSADLIGVTLLDRSTGMIFTHYQLWLTKDAGQSWHEVKVPAPLKPSSMPGMISNAAFFNRNAAWIGGAGDILTRDGGRSWTRVVPSEPPPAISDVFCLPSGSSCWAVGSEVVGKDRRPPVPIIIASLDEGMSWRRERLPGTGADTRLDAVHFFDERLGVAVGEAKVYFTEDAGATWRPSSFDSSTCEAPKAGAGSPAITGWGFRGPSTAWLSLASGAVVRSTHGGASFCQIGTSAGTSFRRLFFASENIGWSLDRWGKVYCTKDSGKSWTPVPTQFSVRDLAVGTDGAAWVLSARGLHSMHLVP